MGDKKKAAIFGSSQYREKFEELAKTLRCEGYEVKIPAFDDHPDFDEYDVCNYNREVVEWADIIYLIWDGRSVGVIFDFGMIFMARKPFKIEYIEKKTVAGVMRKYEEVKEWEKSSV